LLVNSHSVTSIEKKTPQWMI